MSREANSEERRLQIINFFIPPQQKYNIILYSQNIHHTSTWYHKYRIGVGGLILVVGIREKQIICLSESFLNSFLLVSSENTPPLNIFVMFKRTPLRFFKDVLKCPLLEKVLFLAKRVVGNLFFNLILCFPNKKTEF